MEKVVVAILTFLTLVVSPLLAQTNVLGKMEVEVAIPVTAVETELLNFGKVIPDVGGGNIKITANGERSSTGNVTLLDDTYSAGRFVVSGMPSSLVSIVLPQLPQKMILANGDSEIAVRDFVSDVPTGGQVVRQNDGKAEVSIGATLYIGAGLSNPAGYYSGTYEVVFMYN